MSAQQRGEDHIDLMAVRAEVLVHRRGADFHEEGCLSHDARTVKQPMDRRTAHHAHLLDDHHMEHLLVPYMASRICSSCLVPARHTVHRAAAAVDQWVAAHIAHLKVFQVVAGGL